MATDDPNATNPDDGDLDAFRDQLGELLDALSAFSAKIADSDVPVPQAQAALAQLLAPYANASSGTPTQQRRGGKGYPEALDLGEAMKRRREGRPTISAFNTPTPAQKRVTKAGLWPADLSAGKRDSAIAKALGKHAPKAR